MLVLAVAAVQSVTNVLLRIVLGTAATVWGGSTVTSPLFIAYCPTVLKCDKNVFTMWSAASPVPMDVSVHSYRWDEAGSVLLFL